MVEKLNTGDRFPALALNLVGGDTLRLPEQLDARYGIIVFYRGHW